MKTLSFFTLAFAFCGLLSSRALAAGIVQGQPLSAPWMVLISHQGQDHCSGTLIGRRWVLTAAHCFYGLGLDLSELTLGAGGAGARSELRMLPAPKRVYLHPRFRSARTTARDFALIELASPVSFTRDLYAIPMYDLAGSKVSGLRAQIAGWGKVNVAGARAEELTGFTTSFFRTEGIEATTPARSILYSTFRGPEIFAFEASTKLTCAGDSGTGWTINVPALGPHLIAVHSGGDCRSFGVAAELSNVIPWVKDVMDGRLY